MDALGCSETEARVVKAEKLLLLVQEPGDGGSQAGCSSGDDAKWSDWLTDGCGCKEAEKSGRAEELNVSV